MESDKKNQKCSACGNNHVPHGLLYATETAGVIFTMLEDTFPNPITKWLYGITGYFEYLNFSILRELGVVSYTDRTPTLGRAKVLYDEAKRRSWDIKTISILGRPLDYFVATLPNNITIIFRGIPKMLEKPLDAQGWLDDKYLFKQKAQKANIPVPNGEAAWTLGSARKIFEKLKKPVIVKPRQGSRGRHTTTWVQTLEQLDAAFKSAQQLCACVMIEEQLQGSVYRGTVVDGEVVGVLAGDQPRVTGDGQHTIRALIEAKNKSRPDGIAEITIDEKLKEFLARNNYNLETVIENGKAVELSEKIGVAYGGDARNVTREAHPKVIEYIKKAGDLVQDPIVGFDFIIPDITIDPDTQHWGFIECNGLPFINLHHDARIGGHINVAEKVWDYALRETQKQPKKKVWICV